MIKVIKFDRYNDEDVYIYEFENDKLRIGVSDFGAIIQYIYVKKNDKETLITLSSKSIEDYIKSGTYAGACIGRVANRIENGIYHINDKEYHVSINNGPNCNHGGIHSLDERMYKARVNDDILTLSIDSPNGDNGFNGNLHLDINFSLIDDEFKIKFNAINDEDSIYAPTNHTYFTFGLDSCYEVELKINANKYSLVNERQIPYLNEEVKNTPFDFTSFKKIGLDINSNNEQLDVVGGGYDHFYLASDSLKAIARGNDIEVEVYSSLPGVHLYSGNYINNFEGVDKLYNKHGAFALEPSFKPNSVNDKNSLALIYKNQNVTHYIKYKIK